MLLLGEEVGGRGYKLARGEKRAVSPNQTSDDSLVHLVLTLGISKVATGPFMQLFLSS